MGFSGAHFVLILSPSPDRASRLTVNDSILSPYVIVFPAPHYDTFLDLSQYVIPPGPTLAGDIQ